MNNLTPGTIVSVDVGLVTHLGIISDRAGYIISNSLRSGQVTEEPVNVFTNGKTIKVHNYPSKKIPEDVIARAKSKIGQAYSLISWNCEHFVRWVHGLKVESKQLQIGVAVVTTILALFYIVKQRS